MVQPWDADNPVDHMGVLQTKLGGHSGSPTLNITLMLQAMLHSTLSSIPHIAQ
jgi:hypothetical protein